MNKETKLEREKEQRKLLRRGVVEVNKTVAKTRLSLLRQCGM